MTVATKNGQKIVIRNCQETTPSCNDCAATIVTEQFTRTRKGVGTTFPAFREEIRPLFLRISEFGKVLGENCISLF